MDARDSAIAIFFEGIKRNNSIMRLMMSGLDISDGIGRGILEGCAVNNNTLLDVILTECNLGIRKAGILVSALSCSTSPKRVLLSECNIDDDVLGEIVPGIIGRLHQLFSLDLSNNNIGRAGCEVLATWIQDQDCNLAYLGVENELLRSYNDIDDDCAIVLANALKENNKLIVLNLDGNPAITEVGWEAFIEALCDTSSVNATYLSNHTMQDFIRSNLPRSLLALLELNQNTDKEEVAVQKILRYHGHIDMEPFLEWDLRVLPIAISWFDRARDFVEDDEVNSVDSKQQSAIYQFARTLPLMFVPNAKKSGTKRKIGITGIS